MGAAKSGSGLIRDDFEIGVFLGPDGKAGKPVLLVQNMTCGEPSVRWKDAGGGGKFGPGDFAANGARRDADLRIVAQALGFAGIAAGHDVELAVAFSEPDGSGDRRSRFAESGEGKVFLAGDGRRDGHRKIVSLQDRDWWRSLHTNTRSLDSQNASRRDFALLCSG